MKTAGAPEVIVVGLKPPMARFVIREYLSRVRAGESFQPGGSYGGFLEGFDVRFARMDRSHHAWYLGHALWFYGGEDFEVMQIVYPTTAGVWPDDPDAPPAFRQWQPGLELPRETQTRPNGEPET